MGLDRRDTLTCSTRISCSLQTRLQAMERSFQRPEVHQQPQDGVLCKSKIYSVNVIYLEIVVRELTLDTPGLDESHQTLRRLVDCNEFLLCHKKQGVAIWNPWLRQSRWIELGLNQNLMRFVGMGYDDNRSYKIIGSFPQNEEDPTSKRLRKIYDCASDTWKEHGSRSNVSRSSSSTTKQQQRYYSYIDDNSVSLNGTLYRITALENTNQDRLFILGFDFSKEKSFFSCELPCGKNHVRDALVLGVYKGDRFSLLKQCYETKKIEVFVSKDKIDKNRDGEDVVWMSFIQVSIPDFPDLVQASSNYRPSYYIDNDKRLIVCSCDETGRAWIYVLWRNKLIRKVKVDYVVDLWPLHCTYTPSLVMVPTVKQEEVESSSSVTQACDPIGDNKVVRRWVDLFRPVELQV